MPEKGHFLFIKRKTWLSVICLNVLEFYLNPKGFNIVMFQHLEFGKVGEISKRDFNQKCKPIKSTTETRHTNLL